MVNAAGEWTSVVHGHTQSCEGQTCIQVVGEVVTNDPVGVTVQSDEKVHGFSGNVNVGDISDSALVSSSDHPILNEMGEDRASSLGSPHPYSFHLTDKLVLVHYCEHSLVVHHRSIRAKLPGHPSVAIARKLPTHSLDLMAKVHTFLELLDRLLLGLIGEGAASRFHELTSSLDNVDGASLLAVMNTRLFRGI